MGDGAPDVVLVEPPIKGDGFSELLDEICSLLSEAAFPHRESGLAGRGVKGNRESLLLAAFSIPDGDEGRVGTGLVDKTIRN